MKDQIIKFLAYNGKISVVCCSTTNLVEEARKLHDLSPLSTAAMGRVLTITALIGSEMKNKTDKLTIQIKGNGPIGKIVAVSDNIPNVKACITNPHADLPLNEFGKILYEIIKEKVPYLTECIENSKMNSDNQFEYLEKMIKKPEIKILEKPELLSYTPNADDVVLKSNIMYHYQCSEKMADEILKELEEKDENAKEKMMQNILHKEEKRELEQVSFSFQIPISLSILTHLTRHRMHPLLIPEFVPLWDMKNYITPETIKKNANDVYQKAVNENIKMFDEFKEQGIAEEDLIYFYIGAQMLNVITTMNARNLQWVSRMRCCNKAQWQIRFITQEMVRQVKYVAPLIGKGLGPTCITDKYCGEGKESCGLIDKINAK